MKKSKKSLVFILSVLALAAVVAVAVKKYGIPYAVKDTLSRAVLYADFGTCQPETAEFSLQQLSADGRVTLEQSGMLINKQNKLPTGFEPDICEYRQTGVYMNRPMASAYALLSDEIKEKFGEKLLVISHYRTEEEQKQAILEEGENATAVGASEHQAGLALDVYVKNYGGMNFLNSKVGQWVNSNCWKHGFIIRYNYYKQNADGIAYEPWHLRYIGKPHAEIIYKNSLTLEEYFSLLQDGSWHSFGGFLVSLQSGEEISLPTEFESAIISPDNTGKYLVTVSVN